MSILHDARAYTHDWFTRKGFKVMPNGSYQGATAADCDDMILDYISQYHCLPRIDSEGHKLHRPRLLKDSELSKAFGSHLTHKAQEAKANLISTIKFTNESHYSELLTWLMGVAEEASDFELNVMRHILWQIKRKALGLKVVHHLCPVFFGKQDGGKSTAIAKLLEPIKCLVLDWDVQDAIDKANTQTLSDNLVVFLDEMAGMARADINEIKRLITTESLSYRIYYTQRQLTVKQNCTFIGASNKSITENIYDSTGIRRFVEIKCLDKLDWGLINVIDCTKLWQSIDENRERGYYELFKDQLKTHQAQLTVKDEIQSFMHDTQTADNLILTKEISAKKLWDGYVKWRETSGFNSGEPLKLHSFCMKLRTFNLVQKDIKRVSHYMISTSSSLFDASPLQKVAVMAEWANKGVQS